MDIILNPQEYYRRKIIPVGGIFGVHEGSITSILENTLDITDQDILIIESLVLNPLYFKDTVQDYTYTDFEYAGAMLDVEILNAKNDNSLYLLESIRVGNQPPLIPIDVVLRGSQLPSVKFRLSGSYFRLDQYLTQFGGTIGEIAIYGNFICTLLDKNSHEVKESGLHQAKAFGREYNEKRK